MTTSALTEELRTLLDGGILPRFPLATMRGLVEEIDRLNAEHDAVMSALQTDVADALRRLDVLREALEAVFGPDELEAVDIRLEDLGERGLA